MIIIAAVAIIVVYTNISSFSWYQRFNEISVARFGKNIDSSRPELWKLSLGSLKWWQWIIGAGTDVSPMGRFMGGSFHSTYIQLLMQNGIIGLLMLVYTFKMIWYDLSNHCDDMVVRFSLACFVGIIVFNCFESTLLQNKFFMGLIQWIILGIGLIRCNYLDKNNPMP